MPPTDVTPAGSADERREHLQYHRNGTLWARGQMIGDVPEGYWEWFRKDGSMMRSGTFTAGRQAGEWTTYDRNGGVVKVTTIKPGPETSR
ncbi:MAG: hypothetical protein EPN48_06660 [Microbacteriaceae bacterium]|nr:MAG: hypothetical protein EPN48_06660 [Microbacteriaceae bacterium]